MSLQKIATQGVVWTFTQQFGNQIIGFVVSLLLARLLMPEEFGLIGMIAVFISVGQILIHSGLTQSLIRSKELDQSDFSTVFFFNLLASIILYWIIYFVAPFIADFYDREILIKITRIFSLVYIFNAFSAVQQTKYAREMKFRIPAIAALPANLIGGIIGIIMAYNNFGVWSIVWSQLINSILNSVFLWILSDWRPSFIFDFEKFKEHVNFGYKITLTGLLDVLFKNSYLIIIGKFFSPSQVGYYTRAETMKQLPVTNISSILNSVTYPLFSSIQNEDERLKRVYKELIQLVVAIIAPILIFLAVLAKPTFVFLFTEKWIEAVPYFQILCATGILFPIHAYNTNLLKIKGRSDLVLKIEIYKKIIIVVVIAVTIQFGIIALLYGQVLISLVEFFINTHYTKKFINYGIREQTVDISPIIFIALVCGISIFIADKYFFSESSNLVRIIVGVIVGIVLYVILIYFFKTAIINRLKSLIFNQ